MALDIIDDVNKDKSKDASGTPSAPPAGVAPSQPTAASNTVGQGQQANSATGRTGSGFVNLQSILSANRNNNLGSTVGQGLQGVANNVNQGIQTNQDLFKSEMDKNSLGGTGDVSGRQRIIDNITNIGSTPVNTVGQGPNVQQPIANLVSDQDVTNWQRYASGAYQGPQSLRDVDSLQAQAQQAQELGNNISSSGGRQALLQQFVGQGPGYSQGKQTLDSLLLGQTGASNLRSARQTTFGLNNKVAGAENLAEQQSAAAANQAKQFGTDTKNLVGNAGTHNVANTADVAGTGLIGDVYNPLYTSLSTKNSAAGADYTKFQNDLANKNLSTDELEKYIKPLLGTNNQDTSTFGLTPADFAKAFSQGTYNLSNVADPNTYAKIQALQKLSGTTPIGETIDPTQLNKTNAAINEDTSQFSDYAKRNNAYQAALSPLQDQQNQLKYRLDKDINPASQDLQNKLNLANSQTYGGDPYAKEQAIYEVYKSALNDSRFQDQQGGIQTGAANALQNILKQFGNVDENGKVYNGDYSDTPTTPDSGYNSNIFNTIGANTQNQLNNYGQQITNLQNTNQIGSGNIMDLLSPEAKAQYQAANPDSYTKYARLADMYRTGPQIPTTYDGSDPGTTDAIKPGQGYYK